MAEKKKTKIILRLIRQELVNKSIFYTGITWYKSPEGKISCVRYFIEPTEEQKNELANSPFDEINVYE